MKYAIILLSLVLCGCIVPEQPTKETIAKVTIVCQDHDGWNFVKNGYVNCHDGSHIKYK